VAILSGVLREVRLDGSTRCIYNYLLELGSDNKLASARPTIQPVAASYGGLDFGNVEDIECGR
jgi:hypothetical protein